MIELKFNYYQINKISFFLYFDISLKKKDR